MITWMQKHKKYLVITIWISTIAFVGAGFVGWGAYDLNTNRATSVARVGDTNVSIQDFQEKYTQIYNYYNNMMSGNLNKEVADQLGIENLALNAAINDALLINFAKDLGLQANKDDILQQIIQDPNFSENGVFKKELYLSMLKNANIEPREYEKSLEKAVIINKLSNAISLDVAPIDIELFSAAFFSKDRVKIEVIGVDDSDIKIDQEELKKFWDKTKDNYKSKTQYSLNIVEIPINIDDMTEQELKEFYSQNSANYKDENDKILDFEKAKDKAKKDLAIQKSRSEALKKYIAVKKGELIPNKSMTIDNGSAVFNLDEIKDLKVGDTIKPVLNNDTFIVAKISKITPPQNLTFEEAKQEVYQIYKIQKAQEILQQKAKQAMENFNPKQDIWISRDSNETIQGLSKSESLEFAKKLFESNKQKAYVIVGDKAVIYKIVEQKLLDKVSDNYKALVEQNAKTLKNNELLQDLTAQLKKRYKIEEYLKR